MNIRKKICYMMSIIMVLTTVWIQGRTISHAAMGGIGEGYDVENLDKSFATVDDGSVNTTSDGVVTVLVFARTNGSCFNSNAVIGELCESSWTAHEGVRVAVIDIDQASKDVVASMRDSNAASDVRFCYCENRAANNAMWDYLAMTVGDSDTVTLPVIIMIDGNNKVQYCLTGYQSSQTIYTYVKDLVGEDFADLSNPDEISLFLKGTFDEEKAFEVLDLVNEARAEQELDALKMDEGLMEAAMQRAAECAVYYDHTRPNGESCFTVFDDGYLISAAENIAAGYSSSSAVMDGWLNSTGHYANIMGEDFTNLGVGCFYQDGVIYWVQLFSAYGDTQVTQPENYVTTAQVQAKAEYLGELSFRYATNVEVGMDMLPSQLYGVNLGFDVENFYLSPETFSYESVAPEIATVDSNGVLHAASVGDTIITASIGDKISLITYVSVVEKSSSDHNGDNGNDANDLMTGDVDFNGIIDLTDAQLALKIALRIYVPYEVEVLAADMDSDNAVTLNDAQSILKKALKII